MTDFLHNISIIVFIYCLFVCLSYSFFSSNTSYFIHRLIYLIIISHIFCILSCRSHSNSTMPSCRKFCYFYPYFSFELYFLGFSKKHDLLLYYQFSWILLLNNIYFSNNSFFISMLACFDRQGKPIRQDILILLYKITKRRIQNICLCPVFL